MSGRDIPYKYSDFKYLLIVVSASVFHSKIVFVWVCLPFHSMHVSHMQVFLCDNVRIIIIQEKGVLALSGQCSRWWFLCMGNGIAARSAFVLYNWLFSCKVLLHVEWLPTGKHSGVFHERHGCEGLNLSSLSHFLQSRLLPASHQS